MGIVQSAGDAAAHAGLMTAVDQASDGIVFTDGKGVIQYVNPAFTAMTGYSAEEMVGQNPRLLKSGRHRAAFYQELWKTLLSGRVWQGEVTNRRKDGSLYAEEMRIAPVLDAEGALTGYIAIKRDVTEQRAAAAAQTFLAAITEHCEDAIVATSLAGVILTWNHGAEVIFGFTAAEALGRAVSLFTPADRMSRMMDCIDHVGSGEVLKNYEGICQHADGRRMHVAVTGFPIRDASGTVVAAVALLRDITEQHRGEQRLRESEERFRSMADSSSSIMWVTGADGNVEFVNRAYRTFFGVAGEAVLPGERRALLHPEDGAGYRAAFEEAVREHLPFAAEARVRAADGQWRLLGSRAQPRFSPDGEFLGHVGLSADITERRQMDQALRGSREFAQSTIDALSSHLCVLDEAGTIIAVNQAWREFAESNLETGAEGDAGIRPAAIVSARAPTTLPCATELQDQKPAWPPNLRKVPAPSCVESGGNTGKTIHAIPPGNIAGFKAESRDSSPATCPASWSNTSTSPSAGRRSRRWPRAKSGSALWPTAAPSASGSPIRKARIASSTARISNTPGKAWNKSRIVSGNC